MNVYVRLLGEGTQVFRPTLGTPMGPGVVRLIAPTDYDPEDEQWEFKPGSVVRIEHRSLGGALEYVAVGTIETS